MKNLMMYEASGDWPGEDMTYENSITVRDNGSTELLFRTVIRNAEGEALYSRSASTEIGEDTYQEWPNSLDISEYDFGEINESTNLGPERHHADLEELMPSRNTVRYEQPGSIGRKSSLWIREGEASESEVNIRWQGLSPHGTYSSIIGEASVPVTDWRDQREWERDLPEDMVGDLPGESYRLFRRMNLEEVASENGMAPVDLFREFYDGATDDEEYVVIIGDQDTVTLANPWKRQVEEAVQELEAEKLQHLHQGSVEEYSVDEIGELLESTSPEQNAGGEMSRSMPDSMLGRINREKQLTSVEGAIIPEEDIEEVRMRLNSEVKSPL